MASELRLLREGFESTTGTSVNWCSDVVSLLLGRFRRIRRPTTLVDDLVPDELWALVAPLLPAPPRPPYGGRHRTISDRVCFAAIGVHGPHLHPVAATTRPRA